MRLRLPLIGTALVVAAALPAGAAPAAKKSDIPQFGGAQYGWGKTADDFQPPESGPGPVMSDKAHPYIPNNDNGIQVTLRIADLTNPILKPWAIEQMRQANLRAAAGKEAFEARASCRPGGVPGFLVMGRLNPLYVVQSKKEVLLLNEGGPEVRHVLLNVRHSAHPKISPYGESVGHYEGADTLVVDTIGLSPDTYIDNYRTPHTNQLHVVERFQLSDQGKSINVRINVEDPGTFNTAWSARQTYHRNSQRPIDETVCAENNEGQFADAAVSAIPKADKADF